LTVVITVIADFCLLSLDILVLDV